MCGLLTYTPALSGVRPLGPLVWPHFASGHAELVGKIDYGGTLTDFSAVLCSLDGRMVGTAASSGAFLNSRLAVSVSVNL